jgi:hypothetical protein
MATPKYLIQERKGQRSHLYVWTPILAKKEGMRPITIKEAKKYLENPNYQGQDEYADFEEDDGSSDEVTDEGYISDEDEDNAILDDLSAEKGSPLADNEGTPLEVTQEDLLKEEVTQINRFKKKASIEEYMLRKYEIPMLQMEGLDEMKQQAHSTLATLAQSNSLYKK